MNRRIEKQKIFWLTEFISLKNAYERKFDIERISGYFTLLVQN